MKFTINHSSLGRLVLGAGALSLLSFVRADFAQCVPGWEWVRPSLFFCLCGFELSPLAFAVVQLSRPEPL